MTLNHDKNNLRHFYTFLFLVILFLNISAVQAAEEWSYTVKPGDNLWNLTERHLTSMKYVPRLQQLNNVQNPYVIPPGTRLRIPVAWTKITQDAYAHIVNVYGNATVIRPKDGVIPATLGMQLVTGDKIQSENDSFVTVEFADQSRMRVQDNSTVRFDDMKIFGDYGLVDTLLHLEEGRTESSVPKDSAIGTRFRIQTPSAISSVRGTDFRVGTLDKQSATTSEVLDGLVEVSGDKKGVKVSGGFGTVTALGTPPSRPIKLLPSPDLSETAHYYDSLPLVIRLNPLEGAQAYRAQIAIDPEFNTLWSEFTTETLPFRDGDIPDGNYWLRIRGIDASGIEGHDAVILFGLNANPEPPFVTAPLPGDMTATENQEFTWAIQSEASHYTVMISKDEHFTDLVYFNPEVKTNNLTLSESLTPGHYFWQIFSVSATEGAGPFSDAMPFRVPYPGPSIEETEIDKDDLTFAWRAAAEGQRFHFQFARDEAFTDIIHDEITTASRMTIDNPGGGTFYLRTKTIESDGFQGPWGPAQIIEIPHDMPYWLLFLLLLPLLVLI
ncbi:MAG: FecR domain-containing protein [Nitrosomonas sp.]|nr:FecR domain-containing protein [Nitrosomonas sp.]